MNNERSDEKIDAQVVPEIYIAIDLYAQSYVLAENDKLDASIENRDENSELQENASKSLKTLITILMVFRKRDQKLFSGYLSGIFHSLISFIKNHPNNTSGVVMPANAIANLTNELLGVNDAEGDIEEAQGGTEKRIGETI